MSIYKFFFYKGELILEGHNIHTGSCHSRSHIFLWTVILNPDLVLTNCKGNMDHQWHTCHT